MSEDKTKDIDFSKFTSNDWADFWYYKKGLNVFPADGKAKKPFLYKNSKEVFEILWKQYEDKSIPENIFKEWKDKGFFQYGMAVICGKVFRGEKQGLYLNVIDCDNSLGIICAFPDGIVNESKNTIVEQHANKKKAHFYFLSEKPMKIVGNVFSKELRDNNTVPSIEVKANGKQITYCANSLHRDDSRLEIIGTGHIKGIRAADFDEMIKKINDDYIKWNNIQSSGNKDGASFDAFTIPYGEMIKDSFHVKGRGFNRQMVLLRYLDRIKVDNPKTTLSKLIDFGRKFNKKHFEHKLDDSEVIVKAENALQFGSDKLLERLEEEEKKGKQLKKSRIKIKAGKGKRHHAIVIISFNSIKNIEKDNIDRIEHGEKPIKINFDSLYDEVITNSLIEGMDEYKKENPKYDELSKIIQYCLDVYEENGTINVQIDFIVYLNEPYFHVINDSDEFNCWWWNGVKWNHNMAFHISQTLLKYRPLFSNISRGTSTKVADGIAALESTMNVDTTSKEYLKKQMMYIADEYGQYFDFTDGKVKKVDPWIMFYKEPILQIKLDDTVGAPKIFFDFMKDRFDERYIDFVIDHTAGAFLHTSVLRAKPKNLNIIGPTDAYKSMIIEILKKGLTVNMILLVSPESISERFGYSLVGNKIIIYTEELDDKAIKNSTVWKTLTTTESLSGEVKNGKTTEYFWRIPRGFIMCNKVGAIPKDDDDKSLFNRNQYIKIKEPSKVKWRKILLENDSEIQKIFMFLLHRAYEITNEIKPIKMQDIQESKKVHTELTMGGLEAYIEEYYERVANYIATDWLWFWNGFKKHSGDNISRPKLAGLLSESNLEKKTTWTYRDPEQSHVYTEHKPNLDSERTKSTIVTGIRPKKKIKTMSDINDGFVKNSMDEYMKDKESEKAGVS